MPATRPAWAVSGMLSRITCGEIIPRQSIGTKKSMNVQARTFQTMSVALELVPETELVVLEHPAEQDDQAPVNSAAANRETARAAVRPAGFLSPSGSYPRPTAISAAGRRPEQVDDQRPEVEPEGLMRAVELLGQVGEPDQLAERPHDRVGDGEPERPRRAPTSQTICPRRLSPLRRPPRPGRARPPPRAAGTATPAPASAGQSSSRKVRTNAGPPANPAGRRDQDGQPLQPDPADRGRRSLRPGSCRTRSRRA